MAKFLKTALRAGETFHSPDRKVPVTKKRLKHWADGFQKLRAAKYLVPADWDHAATLDQLQPVTMSEQDRRRSAKNTVGHLHEFRLSADGESAELIVEVTDPVAEGRADRNEVFVSPVILDHWKDGHGNEYSDVITHVDFVNHPVDHSQGPFKRLPEVQPGSVALAIRMGLTPPLVRMSDDSPPFDKDSSDSSDDASGSGKTDDENPDMPTGDGSGGDDKQLEAVLAHLRNDGYGLPDDTDASNLVERLLTACLTKEATQQKQDAEDAVDKPDDDDNSDQGTPAVADPGYQTMSLQARSALAYAERQHRTGLRGELDTLLAAGRCTAKEHEDRLKSLGAVKLSLDASTGETIPGDLEKWIESRKVVPKGTFWDAAIRTRMSTVAEPPGELINPEMTDEEAEARVDRMFGKPAAAAK